MTTPSTVPPYGDEGATAGRAPRGDVPPQAVALRDRVRWGPIWAGLIATVATFLVLMLLMVGTGLLTFGTPGIPTAPDATSAVVAAIVGVIAFFVGGWVVGATSAVRGATVGALNGLLMWGLWVALILPATGFGRMAITLGIPPVVPGQVMAPTPGMAWGALVSLVLSALAAALGSWLASLREPLGALSAMRFRGRAPGPRTTAPA